MEVHCISPLLYLHALPVVRVKTIINVWPYLLLFILSPTLLSHLFFLVGLTGQEKWSAPHEAANSLISMGFGESILTSEGPLK